MPTAKLSRRTQEVLRELARRRGTSIKAVLEEAVEHYRRQVFLEEANRAFAALRADPDAWQAEQEERVAWEQTLSDGSEEE